LIPYTFAAWGIISGDWAAALGAAGLRRLSLALTYSTATIMITGARRMIAKTISHA